MIGFALLAVAAFTAETTRPHDSIFALGETVEATFRATGLGAGDIRTLTVRVEDDAQNVLMSRKFALTADAQGSWSKTLALPSDRYGFYRVWADGGDGLSIPKAGSRPAGCMTYAVVIDPMKRRVPSETDCFAGMFGGTWKDTPTRRPDRTWLGMRVGWGADTPMPGAPRRADTRLDRFVTYGGSTKCGHDLVSLLPFFTDEGRAWFRSSGMKNIWDIFAKGGEIGRRHFARGVRDYAIAARAQLPEGRKRLVLEFFSEPDLLSPKPEYIVEAAKIIWETVHPIDPDALIVQPGLSCVGSLNYHRRLFELGLGSYMNAYQVHPYTAYPPEANDYLENIRAIKKLILENCGGRAIPLFAFEAGAAFPWTKEAEQLAGQIRCMLMLLGEGFSMNYGFYPADYGNDDGGDQDGDYGYCYNHELPKVRFGPKTVSPRPIFPAVAGFSMLLDGFRPVVCLDTLGGTAMGYAYANTANAQDVVLALWDYGGKPSTVRLNVGVPTVRLADVFGNERSVATDGGVLAVELGLKPVYVLGVSSACWGKGGREASKCGKGFVKPVQPLSAVGERVGFDGETPTVTVMVENMTESNAEAQVSVRLGVPEARRRGAVTVPAMGRADIRFSLDGFSPDPFRAYELQVQTEDAAGVATVRRSKVNFFAAERVEDFASWRPKMTKYAEKTFRSGERHWKGESDFSLEMGAAWNDDFLMLAFNVSDDDFRQDRTGFLTWAGDSIQLGLAKRVLEKPTANDKTDRYSQAMSEMTFALTQNGPEIYRTYSFDDDLFPSGTGSDAGCVPLSECPFSVVRHPRADGGVVLAYRMAIPWRYFLVDRPVRGDNVLFAAFAVDLDAGMPALQPTILEVFKLKEGRPRKFGRITLK